jgi:hypothetical protein
MAQISLVGAKATLCRSGVMVESTFYATSPRILRLIEEAPKGAALIGVVRWSSQIGEQLIGVVAAEAEAEAETADETKTETARKRKPRK